MKADKPKKKRVGFFKNKKAMIVTGVFLVLALIIGSSVRNSIKNDFSAYPELTYTQLQEKIDAREITDITYGSGPLMKVEDSAGNIYQAQYYGGETFREDLIARDVMLHTTQTTDISTISSLLTIGLLAIFFVPLFRTMGVLDGADWSEKGLLEQSDVKFSDVIGLDEIRQDVQFAVDVLTNRTAYADNTLGVKPPKGMLFEGSPGCGKTLFAKAIAGEAGVPFINVSGSSFVEKFVGLGAQRVRKVFKIARKNAPCVLFIDEIDAVGAARGAAGRISEHDQTINALLTELDGFSGREGVFVIAATNRVDILDDALKRSGRFDRKIKIPTPDNEARIQLFNHYLKDKPLSDNVDIPALSKQLARMSGADIANICNEAANIALQNNKSVIDRDCLEEAVDKIVFGGNRVSKEKQNSDRTIVAYHEAGHAVMTYLTGEKIARISVVENTNGVGGAVFREEPDTCFMTKESIENAIKIAYAGRVSEEIKFGKDKITTGAYSDIQQATKYIKQYVQSYGFNGVLLDFGQFSQEQSCDTKEAEALAKRLYEEAHNELDSAYKMVTALAEKLLKVKTMTGTEAIELLEQVA